MCTWDCRCYEGANGEVKQKWEAYGDVSLNKFQRTAGPKNIVFNEKPAYPMKWTSDPAQAFSTFKECYE